MPLMEVEARYLDHYLANSNDMFFLRKKRVNYLTTGDERKARSETTMCRVDLMSTWTKEEVLCDM